MDEILLIFGIVMIVLGVGSMFNFPILINLANHPRSQGVLIGAGIAYVMCSFYINPIIKKTRKK